MRSFFLATITFCILISCKKNSNYLDSENVSITSSGICTEKNIQNPLDTVGTLHNSNLDFVVNSFIITTQFTLENLMDSMRQMSINQYGFDAFILSDTQMTSKTQSIINNGYASVLDVNDPSQFMIVKMIDSVFTLEDDFDYCEAKDIIMFYENEISNSNLTQNKKDLFYVTSSTFRQSLYYWQSNANVQTTGGKWKKKIVAAADATGTALGWIAVMGNDDLTEFDKAIAAGLTGAAFSHGAAKFLGLI